VTLIELIALGSIIYAGYACGKFIGSHFGIIGWIIGVVIGALGAIGGWFALGKLGDMINKWRPLRPICKKGKCSADDYEIVQFLKDGTIYRCKCGTGYFRSRRRFLEVLDNGETVPYMKRHGLFGRWEPDPDTQKATN